MWPSMWSHRLVPHPHRSQNVTTSRMVLVVRIQMTIYICWNGQLPRIEFASTKLVYMCVAQLEVGGRAGFDVTRCIFGCLSQYVTPISSPDLYAMAAHRTPTSSARPNKTNCNCNHFSMFILAFIVTRFIFIGILLFIRFRTMCAIILLPFSVRYLWAAGREGSPNIETVDVGWMRRRWTTPSFPFNNVCSCGCVSASGYPAAKQKPIAIVSHAMNYKATFVEIYIDINAFIITFYYH